MKRFFLVLLILFASLLFAGESDEDFRFIYFTDVHLEEGKNAVQGFESAIKKINELNPDFIISGGDNIADALAVPFETADLLYTMYKNIIKGEYCARTTKRCIGRECGDYGDNGCKIYFRARTQG